MTASRGARGNRSGPLAPVAAVAELMVVQTAGKLGLLEVRRDMLVGHLLKPSLEEVDFLYDG